MHRYQISVHSTDIHNVKRIVKHTQDMDLHMIEHMHHHILSKLVSQDISDLDLIQNCLFAVMVAMVVLRLTEVEMDTTNKVLHISITNNHNATINIDYQTYNSTRVVDLQFHAHSSYY